jgi:error-prone DNA polymerase
MGFYSPAQLVRDAREHGVIVRPVDVNVFRWDSHLQPDPASRGGWRSSWAYDWSPAFRRRRLRLSQGRAARLKAEWPLPSGQRHEEDALVFAR